MNLQKYYAEKASLINKRLDELVAEKELPHDLLFKAARYSLLAPGKRLRPILAIAVVEMLGGESEMAVTPACALEMIHAYSLIHDDLPCMDNDDFRRGRPTLHKAYSEGLAVLAGDFLLTYAFEVLTTCPEITAEQQVQLVKTLARGSGGDGMIGGQVLDIASANQKIDLERLQLIHAKKTGALITTAVEFGGILARASTEETPLLRKYGENLGLAFQIVDDILDVTQSKAKHGNAVSSDIRNNKTTYVSLLGLEQSGRAAKKLIEEALYSLSKLSGDTAALVAIAKAVVAPLQLAVS